LLAVGVLVAACEVEAVVPDVFGGKPVRREVGVASFVQPAGEELEVIAITALSVVRETLFDFAVIYEWKDEFGKWFVN
jgi:hypothetical protein